MNPASRRRHLLLMPPAILSVAGSQAGIDAGAAAEAADVAASHLLNLLFYLPAALMAAAVCLEVFAQRKGLRDLEPGILFLLFLAAGGAAASVAASLWLGAGEGGRFSTFIAWAVLVVVFISVTFYLKRQCRNRRLFSLTPASALIGRVVVPRNSTAKSMIVGYRVLLVLSFVAALAAVSEVPLARVPLQSLAAAVRGVSGPQKVVAASPAAAGEPGSQIAPAEIPKRRSEPSEPELPPELPSLSALIAPGATGGGSAPSSEASPPPEPEPSPATAPPEGAMAATPPPEAPATAPPEAQPPPPPAPTPVAAATAQEMGPGTLPKNFFVSVVKPIFDSKCTSCHGSGKQKGDLRLDSAAEIRKSTAIVPGKPDASALFTRLVSPDPEDMMPPKGEGGPLPAAQIEAVKRWIAAGADFGDGSGGSIPAVAIGGQPGGQIEEALSRQLQTPDAALLSRLAAAGVVIRPLSANGAVLDLNFSHSDLPEIDLTQLAPIYPNIYALDLTRLKLSEGQLAPLAQMINLRRLQLNRNPIGDAALVHLRGLNHLESLNLYDTEVSDAGLEHLAGLRSLQKLYLFNTKVTEAGAEKLRSQRPDLVINLGL